MPYEEDITLIEPSIYCTDSLDKIWTQSNTADLVQTPAEPPYQRAKRVSRQNWEKSKEPLPASIRPGPKAKKSDEELSPEELERKNRRREQNKEAAGRKRKREQAKLDKLQSENADLKREVDELRAGKEFDAKRIKLLEKQVQELQAGQVSQVDSDQVITLSFPESNTAAPNSAYPELLSDQDPFFSSMDLNHSFHDDNIDQFFDLSTYSN